MKTLLGDFTVWICQYRISKIPRIRVPLAKTRSQPPGRLRPIKPQFTPQLRRNGSTRMTLYDSNAGSPSFRQKLANFNGIKMLRAARPLSVLRFTRPRIAHQRSLLTQSYVRGPPHPPLLEQTVAEHFASIVSRYGDRTAFAHTYLHENPLVLMSTAE